MLLHPHIGEQAAITLDGVISEVAENPDAQDRGDDMPGAALEFRGQRHGPHRITPVEKRQVDHRKSLIYATFPATHI
jgi:hypothetical protein